MELTHADQISASKDDPMVDELITGDALEFLAHLDEKFEDRRQKLLKRRERMNYDQVRSKPLVRLSNFRNCEMQLLFSGPQPGSALACPRPFRTGKWRSQGRL